MKKRDKIIVIIAVVSMIIILALGGTYFYTDLWRKSDSHASENHQKEHSDGKDNHDKHEEEGHGDHEDKKEGHGDHEGGKKEGQGEHEEEKVVRLSNAEMKEFKIDVNQVGPGKLKVYVSLPGEVGVNADRSVHVFPRLIGVVREVRKNLGDRVSAGEVIAVLESRELADATSEYLAGRERVLLARATFKREKTLWRQEISSEQDYLNAKQTLAEARIRLQSAEQKLHALGLSEGEISSRLGLSHLSFTRYEITAPFNGTVIEKHISLGEALKTESKIFLIADLSSVWVDLSVYQKDLPLVKKGQSVVISAGHGIPDTVGRISYIGPVVGEKTRTAIARVVLPNPRGTLRPGLFITGNVVVKEIDISILIPKTALQTIDGKTQVFVKTKEGFEPQTVILGQANKTHVEVTSGLEAGQVIVTKGAFTLKSQLAKGEFASGHSH